MKNDPKKIQSFVFDEKFVRFKGKMTNWEIHFDDIFVQLQKVANQLKLLTSGLIHFDQFDQ